MPSFRRLHVCGWTIGCVVLAAAGASAQTAAGSNRLYGLDPYKPSDAAWLRNYGAVLAGMTPVSVLASLDPYTPSHAALVRQLGGGMPLWSPYWFWFGPAVGPLIPPYPPAALPGPYTCPVQSAVDEAAKIASLLASPARPATAPAPAMASASTAVPSSPPAATTLERPRNNDGISIQFADRVWIAAGRAVPRATLDLVRAGEYAGAPVFRRPNVDDVIYVQTRGNLVAPFRAKP